MRTCASPVHLPRKYVPDELITPPTIIASADGGGSSDDQHGFDALSHQQRLGIEATSDADPQQNTRQPVIDNLCQFGSTPEDGVTTSRRMVEVWELCNRLHMRYESRMLADAAWCGTIAKAAAAAAASSPATDPPPRIIVLGLGSGVPALSAGRAGAEVLWVIRVARYAEVARALVARNRLQARVRVITCSRWVDLPPRLPPMPSGGLAREAHACLTEEIGDDPLSEGVLPLARLAHALLLRRGGVFGPCRLRVYATLASVRTICASGFDLRAFNAFRSTSGACQSYDLEDALLTERPGTVAVLSAPALLFDLDLSRALPPTSVARPVEVQVDASEGGVLNCLCWWADLCYPSGEVYSSAPPLCAAAEPPRSSCRRAFRQRLTFCGYERRLSAGEPVRVLASISRYETAVRVEAPPDERAAEAGTLVRWPATNACGVLSYHFPMIADEGRNAAFDGALARAVRLFVASHGGRRPRVLDIGSGSGLLAMMAARAGAAEVHSLEMVPALAAAAREIVARNGYAECITIHGEMSTRVAAAALGGHFDILVCEIVDDMLLGEGILTTVTDARRRLLTPSAAVLPRSGCLWVLAVEMKPPAHDGIDLADMSTFLCDLALTPEPLATVKLQHLRPGVDYRTLSEPLRLFDFDFASGDLQARPEGPTNLAFLAPPPIIE